MLKAENKNKSVIVYRLEIPPAWRGVAGLQTFINPFWFLARAMEGGCARLLVFLEWSTFWEKEALLELCAVLRTSPSTRDLPFGCILHEKHREDLARLAKSRVEWIAFPALNQSILPILFVSPQSGENGWLRLDKVLREMCPNLNYLPVKEGRGICVCGAYRNRLVLGQETLSKLCQAAGHSHCPYFMDPHPAGSGVEGKV